MDPEKITLDREFGPEILTIMGVSLMVLIPAGAYMAYREWLRPRPPHGEERFGPLFLDWGVLALMIIAALVFIGAGFVSMGDGPANARQVDRAAHQMWPQTLPDTSVVPWNLGQYPRTYAFTSRTGSACVLTVTKLPEPEYYLDEYDSDARFLSLECAGSPVPRET